MIIKKGDLVKLQPFLFEDSPPDCSMVTAQDIHPDSQKTGIVIELTMRMNLSVPSADAMARGPYIATVLWDSGDIQVFAASHLEKLLELPGTT